MLARSIANSPSWSIKIVAMRPSAQAARSLPHNRAYAALAAPTKPARSGDMVWMIGAAAVFGPTMAYLMTPAAAHHSSTSHAHPVPDRWSRSLEKEDLESAQLNRPIIADDDGIARAGEGRPHGLGDKAIRQITKATETHADHQVTRGIVDDMKAIPEKMSEARALSALRTPDSTTIDTKAVSAQAHAKHDAKYN